MALTDANAVLAEAARLLAHVVDGEECTEAEIAAVLDAALRYLDPTDTEAVAAVRHVLDGYDGQQAMVADHRTLDRHALLRRLIGESRA